MPNSARAPLLRRALERDLPVLALCRGHQLLNVAMGGSLVQYIEGDGHRDDEGLSRWHEVSLTAGGGRLGDVYRGGREIRVNLPLCLSEPPGFMYQPQRFYAA